MSITTGSNGRMMTMNKIIIGADHAGFKVKEKIKKYLKELNYQVESLKQLL